MSSVIVVSPIIIATWPVIAHAIAGVVTSIGFSVLRESDQQSASERSTTQTAELEVPDSEVLGEAVVEAEGMVVERDGVLVRFNRDRRGALKLCVSGDRSKRELQQLGEQLMGSITQQYVYHKVMSELGDRGVPVLNEEVTPDRTVKIRVRAW